LFAEAKRENPVDLLYPYIAQDKVTVILAPGLEVESLPGAAHVSMQQSAAYSAKYSATGKAYNQERVLALGITRFKAEDYPQLRDFFQKAGAQDQQHLVLKRAR
jgi:hypothetical protein